MDCERPMDGIEWLITVVILGVMVMVGYGLI